MFSAEIPKRRSERTRSTPAVLFVHLLIFTGIALLAATGLSCAGKSGGERGSVSEQAEDNAAGGVQESKKKEGEEEDSGYFGETVLSIYNNPDYKYRIGYPVEWKMDEGPVSYGYRISWKSPDDQMSFLVDSSYTGGREDPSELPVTLDEERRASTPGYRRQRLEPMNYEGCPACLWEYSIGEEKTLDFFVEGSEYGYAILFKAQADTYDRVIDSFKSEVLFKFVPDRVLSR